MRDQTRSYTTDLPRINLQFLTHLRDKLGNATPNTQVYCDTESGRLYLSQFADGYSATINGVTRRIGITATRVGYGVREWYVCPTVANGQQNCISGVKISAAENAGIFITPAKAKTKPTVYY
ncbi:hypothetical protein WCU84_15865 [Dickeya chrysanthemi]|uniref:Uncharacterized protein n=1 Tax=Dickeya chrysanthemi TaxID=556 RepID=A0ABU8JNY3_DICCH